MENIKTNITPNKNYDSKDKESSKYNENSNISNNSTDSYHIFNNILIKINNSTNLEINTKDDLDVLTKLFKSQLLSTKIYNSFELEIDNNLFFDIMNYQKIKDYCLEYFNKHKSTSISVNLACDTLAQYIKGKDEFQVNYESIKFLSQIITFIKDKSSDLNDVALILNNSTVILQSIKKISINFTYLIQTDDEMLYLNFFALFAHNIVFLFSSLKEISINLEDYEFTDMVINKNKMHININNPSNNTINEYDNYSDYLEEYNANLIEKVNADDYFEYSDNLEKLNKLYKRNSSYNDLAHNEEAKYSDYQASKRLTVNSIKHNKEEDTNKHKERKVSDKVFDKQNSFYQFLFQLYIFNSLDVLQMTKKLILRIPYSFQKDIITNYLTKLKRSDFIENFRHFHYLHFMESARFNSIDFYFNALDNNTFLNILNILEKNNHLKEVVLDLFPQKNYFYHKRFLIEEQENNNANKNKYSDTLMFDDDSSVKEFAQYSSELIPFLSKNLEYLVLSLKKFLIYGLKMLSLNLNFPVEHIEINNFKLILMKFITNIFEIIYFYNENNKENISSIKLNYLELSCKGLTLSSEILSEFELEKEIYKENEIKNEMELNESLKDSNWLIVNDNNKKSSKKIEFSYHDINEDSSNKKYINNSFNTNTNKASFSSVPTKMKKRSSNTSSCKSFRSSLRKKNKLEITSLKLDFNLYKFDNFDFLIPNSIEYLDLSRLDITSLDYFNEKMSELKSLVHLKLTLSPFFLNKIEFQEIFLELLSKKKVSSLQSIVIESNLEFEKSDFFEIFRSNINDSTYDITISFLPNFDILEVKNSFDNLLSNNNITNVNPGYSISANKSKARKSILNINSAISENNTSEEGSANNSYMNNSLNNFNNKNLMELIKSNITKTTKENDNDNNDNNSTEKTIKYSIQRFSISANISNQNISSDNKHSKNDYQKTPCNNNCESSFKFKLSKNYVSEKVINRTLIFILCFENLTSLEKQKNKGIKNYGKIYKNIYGFINTNFKTQCLKYIFKEESK